MMSITIDDATPKSLTIFDVPVGHFASAVGTDVLIYRINTQQWCWLSNEGNTFVLNVSQCGHKITRIFGKVNVS